MLPLTVNKVTLEKQGALLADSITFSLRDSGVTVLMGPNGAGKSVLLRLLHGLMIPDSGTILWDGRAPLEDVRRSQAMMFQRPVLLRRSVQANMEFVFRQRRKYEQNRTCDSLIELVGLGGKQFRAARQLSGGEQQRLALARALALEPRVLFMDEPAASLDPASTATIESVVRDLKNSSTKVIFVTHDVAQAHRVADDVLFLHHGRLMEHSNAKHFFENPESDEARQYLAGEIVI